jgi:predicted outer membrane repeat protein
VDRCHFVDLDARPDESGGGIQVGHSDVEVLRCRFENCHAFLGGAIHVTDSNLWVDAIEVESCAAGRGGGISASSTGPQHNLSFEVRSSRFIDNWVGNGGGAISQGGNGFRASRIVENCYFEGNRAGGSGGAISLQDFETGLVVRDNVFVDNGLETNDTIGGAALLRGTDVEIRNNTFHRCRQDNLYSAGSALWAAGATTLSLENNLFSENIGAAAVQIRPDVLSLDGGCNVFWDNEGGTMEGAPLDPTDRIVDPLYCDPDAYDLTLSSQSPCLPANSLGCGLIGALGQDCGTVSVTPMSWSRIKGAYR